MQDDRFDVPLIVKLGDTGNQLTLRSVHDASEFLLHHWPGKRTPKHRAALQACYDVMYGHKPAMAARRAFVAAARETDVLVHENVSH
jgi:Protein of unknown function (DUF982)